MIGQRYRGQYRKLNSNEARMANETVIGIVGLSPTGCDVFELPESSCCAAMARCATLAPAEDGAGNAPIRVAECPTPLLTALGAST